MKKHDLKAEFISPDNTIALTDMHPNRFASARPGPAAPESETPAAPKAREDGDRRND